MEEYTEGEEFISEKVPLPGTFEGCVFRKCHWLEADLSRFSFIECEFIDCDLSLVQVNNTTFNGVVFIRSKLTGIRFDYADNHLFDVKFTECLMPLTSFYQRKMKDMSFITCDLKEADFAGCNLTDSRFDHCNLAGALFKECILRNTDFRTSENVNLELTENDVRGAHFRWDQIPDLISSFNLNIES